MATTDPLARAVVCDAGPLIHLDELGCLALLSDFVRVLLPASVWEEVSRHRPAALTGTDVALEQSAAAAPLPADLAGLGRLFALHRAELDALWAEHRETGADPAVPPAVPTSGTWFILVTMPDVGYNGALVRPPMRTR